MSDRNEMKLSVCMRLPRDYIRIQNIWLCFDTERHTTNFTRSFCAVCVCVFFCLLIHAFFSLLRAISVFCSFLPLLLSRSVARSLYLCIHFIPGHFPLNFFIQGNHTHAHTHISRPILTIPFISRCCCCCFFIHFTLAHFIWTCSFYLSI